MKRVGILLGGMPTVHDELTVPPSQRLKIAEYTELFAYVMSPDAYASPASPS